MAYSVVLDPQMSWQMSAVCLAATLIALGMAIRAGMAGWIPRTCLAAVLAAAILNPSVRMEAREKETDYILILADRTSSQKLGERTTRTEEALAWLRSSVPEFGSFELREAELLDAEGGTRLASALRREIEDLGERLAAAFVVTDGLVHDADVGIESTAPVHILLTTGNAEMDRRILIRDAPKFALVGEPASIVALLEDTGSMPRNEEVGVEFYLDGALQGTIRAMPGEPFSATVRIDSPGPKVAHFKAAAAEGELTLLNNEASVEINGVQERLRVLMVSGIPHAGQRTWRNILMSDASVELVHLTFLRNPESRDSTAIDELALIQFPARELFQEKLEQFDLVVLDRYRRVGLLTNADFERLAEYVEGGGALLVAGGPELADPRNLHDTAVGRVLPAEPTGFIAEKAFRPAPTSAGMRHPVTDELHASSSSESGADPEWGRWFRQAELRVENGDVLMAGADGRPLLVLFRAGQGRVALLASDQAWLWHRGFEGGGPQQELLKRLVHWMMKEPGLEEEALYASAYGTTLRIVRQSMSDDVPELELFTPSGGKVPLLAAATSPGRFEALIESPDPGIHIVRDGDLSAAVSVGLLHPLEFEGAASGGSAFERLVADMGGVFSVESGFPDARLVQEGRAAAGRAWAGVLPRNNFIVSGIEFVPLTRPVVFALLILGLACGAWHREGR